MDAEFRFDLELPVRYRDVDTLAHVNNAVYATYLEQARVRYVDHVLGSGFQDGGMVLADVEIDFRRPVTFEAGSVRVECGVVDVGESSFRMGYRVHAGGEAPPAATAESVQVAWDGDSARPVPEPWRAAFRAFEPALE
jgi:acyl-CoA thioester hydrolase